MGNTAKILSLYAADTAGVCSALYELGGLVVVHDASGCNSTYSTHDEPRWEFMKSNIFISALTEMDAVMGNDEKLIEDTVSAAKDLQPKFIALCGSPMPMMTGVDYEAISEEIERRTGIYTFAIKTNGIGTYVEGASDTFLELIRHYAVEGGEPRRKDAQPRINILGETPLDLTSMTAAGSIRKWVESLGLCVNLSLAMDCSIEDIKRAGEADISLVVSASGIKSAEMLNERFGIPYVMGVPLGNKYSTELSESILRTLKSQNITTFKKSEETINHTENQSYVREDITDSIISSIHDNDKVYIIGDSVFSDSLRREIVLNKSADVRVICMINRDLQIMKEKDIFIDNEEDLEKLISGQYENFPAPDIIIADPLFNSIIPNDMLFYGLPHRAFSGRCFDNIIQDIISKPEC